LHLWAVNWATSKTMLIKTDEACIITCLGGMLLTVSVAITKFRCHVHWIIWLQSGYNPANNPAYNCNQTRPYVWNPKTINFFGHIW
jgi:hypothetical protein